MRLLQAITGNYRKESEMKARLKSCAKSSLIICIVTMLVLTASLCGCGGSSSIPEAVTGYWSEKSYSALFPVAAIEINSDGTGSIQMDYLYSATIRPSGSKYKVTIVDGSGPLANFAAKEAKQAYNISVELNNDGTMTVHVKAKSGYMYMGTESSVFVKAVTSTSNAAYSGRLLDQTISVEPEVLSQPVQEDNSVEGQIAKIRRNSPDVTVTQTENGYSVVIPEGRDWTAQGEFNGCTDMVSVSIPSSMEDIGMDTFYGCTGLECVTILNPNIMLSESLFYAFENCENIKDVFFAGTKEQWDALGLYFKSAPSVHYNCTEGEDNVELPEQEEERWGKTLEDE